MATHPREVAAVGKTTGMADGRSVIRFAAFDNGGLLQQLQPGGTRCEKEKGL
jgi:hypothetical protein